MATPATDDHPQAPPALSHEVLRTLVREGPTAARDLIEQLDAAPATVARAAHWLNECSLVEQRPDLGSSTAGRPTVPFAYSRHRVFLGVQIVDHEGSPAELVGVVTDVGGRLISPEAEPKQVSLRDQDRTDQSHLIERLAQFIRDLGQEAGWARVLGVGVAVGGHVHNGVVHLSPGTGWGRLSAWGGEAGGLPLQDLLQQQLAVPVLVDNDITAFTAKVLITDAEPGIEDFAVICLLGYGIGGGLVRDRTLYRGVHGLAIEPGHLVVDYGPDTPLCRCGNRGCVEAYTAPVKILERIVQETAASDDVPTMISMRAAGKRSADDEQVSNIFREAGRALGRGLANIVNTTDPGVIYLFAQPELLRPAEDSAASNWLQMVRATLEAHAFSIGKQTPLITRAKALNELEAISAQGAACLGVERLLDELNKRATSSEQSTCIMQRVSALMSAAAASR